MFCTSPGFGVWGFGCGVRGLAFGTIRGSEIGASAHKLTIILFQVCCRAKNGTHKTVQARCWPWLAVQRPQNPFKLVPFDRKRPGAHSTQSWFRAKATESRSRAQAPLFQGDERVLKVVFSASFLTKFFYQSLRSRLSRVQIYKDFGFRLL